MASSSDGLYVVKFSMIVSSDVVEDEYGDEIAPVKKKRACL